jgi:dTMP kinase
MYIAIEGIDTAGKSTQIDLLKKSFKEALVIKEPGFTNMGMKLREIIFKDDICSKAELFLFLADRSETVEKIIKPNLNKTIISDRSLISGIAYGMHSFEFEKLLELNRFATDGIFPDRVIILKLSKEELIKRLSLKSHDNIEKRGVDYLLTIQQNLIKTCEKLNIKSVIIDASEKQENIHKQIKKELNGR